MMFFAHICAYYFAVGIRYFGYFKKISTSFSGIQFDYTAILQQPQCSRDVVCG